MTPSDRKTLVRLASALPESSDERRALQGLLSREASVKAVEPYQGVSGQPYGSSKFDAIKGVRTERDLRVLSKLLDDLYGKPLTPDSIKKMKKYGISSAGMEALSSGGGGYMLYLTDTTGEEYDVFNDLGI